ncbi:MULTISPECIES: glycosyltransferase family 39 protein [Sorangium]|uniref:Glycosyltransferase RgtA/B/C/D-like domain-containing protein n=1 Tax=Sorangium cellulosum TaxID=56 RepID=A0A4P2QYQ8_SORCE|nr:MULTISPECIES: glycosyltransferase family 39 protein [Sorangium]AUX35699.1 hypothetical protein SOCE836_078970 [Sorangium cellulosum]WCQ94998.1 hypothetical protein NQZ70_07773 [Sorangium sp. Soce836]
MGRNQVNRAALVGAVATALMHLPFLAGYGYFRDELYYLACARELDFGYVDHPPLSIALLWLVSRTLGESVIALRWVPALAHALTVAIAACTARALGGGRAAQALAMLTTALAPVYLGLSSFYSMNALDLALWGASAWFFVRVLQEGDSRSWVALGATLGLALLNKLGALWLIAGMGGGLLLTRRDLLRTRAPWLTLLGALACGVPYLLWQMKHGWPTAAFLRGATQSKMAEVSWAGFSFEQIEMMHPLYAPIWLAGLGYLWIASRGRLRPVSIAYLTIFALLALSGKSRASYLAPYYTVLLAAGSVAVDGLRQRWAKPLVIVAVALGGIATAPLALPILSVHRYLAYAKALGVAPATEEKKQVGALPQLYADMHGWDAVVAAVARAYATLDPEERSRAGIFTANYGEAGTVDLLGPSRGLPRAISGHNNYGLWGPRGASGDVLLVVVSPRHRGRLEALFEEVTPVTPLDCGWCMPYEAESWVYRCRRPRVSLAAAWPRLIHYD